jgi:diguanylate cyclase (GGDEF)-like protein
MALATLLAIYLYNNNVPIGLLIIWLSAMIFVCSGRIIYCKLLLSKEPFLTSVDFHLKVFFSLVLISGMLWASIYFSSIPYTTDQQKDVIMLFFGGMTAASTTNLSVFLPALLVYVSSIFVPIIIYNYSFLDSYHSILATTFLLYLLALAAIAKTNQGLLKSVFFLTEQVKILSITDELSGLYNRRHFTKMIHDEYNRAKRNQQSFALISIDIDNFKLINDSLGHPFGDTLIIYTANYLKYYMRRANDLIFRMGGDEFVALLINASAEKTNQICNEIKTQFLKTPEFYYENIDSHNKNILAQVSISIGAVYVPYDATRNIEQIIEQADQLLYESKNNGKNQIRFAKCI